MLRHIDIIEVGPRDGFQNLCSFVPTATKLEFIDGLIRAGVRHIQITSFVSPKAIPQMQDAAELARTCLERYPELDLFALVPNLKGAASAVETGMRKVANVISLSESHNKANIRRTHRESFDDLLRIRDTYPDLQINVDVATSFGCPFEGKFSDQTLVDFIGTLHGFGMTTFNLCDTTGMANPAQVRSAVQQVQAAFPSCRFEVHIHDTRNMGMACTLAAVESGISAVQTTLGGLGGCPFAPGASGNTATEDLVYMLHEMGYTTGIDFTALLALAKHENKTIPGNYSGHHININAPAA